ncbi:MAG: hypothetical protein ACJAVS_001370 [Paracoccaceae bacterium]|jgi:hypothetical protein
MDDVFGAGNWNLATFEAVNVTTLVAVNDLILLDGGDEGMDEPEVFLAANSAVLDAFVFWGWLAVREQRPARGRRHGHAVRRVAGRQ